METGTPGTWRASLTPDLFARQRTVSSPRFSPDGHAIAFAVEFDGRTDLFVSTDGGWPRQITADHGLVGGNFAWSPDGSTFVFTAATDGKLWVCPSHGGQPSRLTLREGRHHSPKFSPDGRYISFICDRGDEIDVVAFSVDGYWQRTLSRGSDFPMDPSWSPDSTRVVWHAYPNNLMPWDQSSLVIADLASGEPRTVAGAPRTAYANARFSPDGSHIVCTCDRGGFLNITEMTIDGSEQRQLHPDSWEHYEPAYSPDGRQIAYTRNVDGDYAIWVVPSGGGSPRALTSQPGRAAAPSWSPDGRHILFVHESPIAPPDLWSVEVESGQLTQRSSMALGGLPLDDLVLPEHVSWTSADGFEVNGLLYAPRDIQPGRHPLLVEIHGGPMNQSRAVWNALLQMCVQQGWVVVQPNYRGTLGYGRVYREALFGSWGKGDLDDYVGGVELCAERNLIRRDRVVAWGGSAGGYSTLLCVTGAPQVFAGGVALFGIYDLYTFGLETHRYERYYVETILGKSADNYPLWHERSPLNFIDKVKVPLLLLHGDKDPMALLEQSNALERELKKHHVDYDYAIYPGEGHGFRKVSTNVDYAQRMNRYLCQKVLRTPLPGPLGTMPYPPMPL